MKLLCVLITTWGILDSSHGVSTKLGFDEESETITNSSKIEDEDVEVQHTIVVSTKLKNNNRRGLHGNNEGDSAFFYGRKNVPKDDSGEVPVIKGYKAVETTAIRTPDTRNKAQIYPESVFVNRNIRDDYDVYPNVATNPLQWKPSTNFNNINWWSPENDLSFVRRIDRPNQTPGKLHRTITDDSIQEFYCRKCREMSGVGYRDCWQQRNVRAQTTTPKMKLDGKLAKLN